MFLLYGGVMFVNYLRVVLLVSPTPNYQTKTLTKRSSQQSVFWLLLANNLSALKKLSCDHTIACSLNQPNPDTMPNTRRFECTCQRRGLILIDSFSSFSILKRTHYTWRKSTLVKQVGFQSLSCTEADLFFPATYPATLNNIKTLLI